MEGTEACTCVSVRMDLLHLAHDWPLSMRPRHYDRFVLIGLCWLHGRSEFPPPHDLVMGPQQHQPQLHPVISAFDLSRTASLQIHHCQTRGMMPLPQDCCRATPGKNEAQTIYELQRKVLVVHSNLSLTSEPSTALAGRAIQRLHCKCSPVQQGIFDMTVIASRVATLELLRKNLIR